MDDEREEEIWLLSKHAIARWNQRVSDGDARMEIEEFLKEASLRRRPPKWSGDKLVRRRRRPRNEPISFAMSPGWPGVCLVVDRATKSVITAIAKE